MSKALEYCNNIVYKREKECKKMIKKYYDKECSKEELVEENRKLLEDYRNLEVIINKELKINK